MHFDDGATAPSVGVLVAVLMGVVVVHSLRILFVVVLSSWFHAPVKAQSQLHAMWAVDFHDGIPVVTINELVDSKSNSSCGVLPISSFRTCSFEMCEPNETGHRVVVRAGLLGLDVTGALKSGFEYHDMASVPVGILEFEYISKGSAVDIVDRLLANKHEGVIWSCVGPRGSILIIDNTGTSMFDTSSGGSDILSSERFQQVDVSPDGRIAAVAASTSDADVLLVFDTTGSEIYREDASSGVTFAQASLVGDDKYVIYDLYSEGDYLLTRCVEISCGIAQELSGLVSGRRYYSADRSRVLVKTFDSRSLYFVDVAHPRDPKELWMLDADDFGCTGDFCYINGAAIAPSGAHVSVGVVSKEKAQKQHSTLFVFNRDGVLQTSQPSQGSHGLIYLDDDFLIQGALSEEEPYHMGFGKTISVALYCISH